MTLTTRLAVPLLRLVTGRQLQSQLRNFSEKLQKEPWHFRNLSPFGKLHLSVGKDSLHVVQPIEPVQNPNQDEAIVRSNQPERVHCECIESDIMVKEDGSTSNGLICEYLVPLKFGIEANLQENAGVNIHDMESGNIQVHGENGCCHLKNIKCDNLQVRTSGPVFSQSTLHCNGDIHTTGSGAVSVNKLLGTSLMLSTDSGNVSLDSLYVEDCSISTKSGNISLGSTHKTVAVEVREKGDLNIGTLDGSLSARVNSGNVKLHITQLGNCDIQVKQGDVEVQLSDSLDVNVDITATSVSLDSQFNTSKIQQVQTSTGIHYKGSIETSSGKCADDKPGSLKIVSLKGKVTLQSQDWFSSLGLEEST